MAVENGRIVAVGRRASVLHAAGSGADVRDLGDVVLLPGLVNAHTHLELSWLRSSLAPGDYMTWLRALAERREQEDEATAMKAAEAAVDELLARGTVAVGDVSNGVWIASVLAGSSLRGIVFHEMFGFPAALAERLLAEAAGRLDAIEDELARAPGRLRMVLTPHAPHSTSGPLLKALAGRAGATQDPLSIHVAESEAEVQFLHDGSGPFREFLIERRAWDESWTPPGHSPVEHLDRLGVLTPRTLAVHCVHLGAQDLSKLQARGVTVVTCPRSNQRLGVGRAPVPRMLSVGIPVALGTDSLASAPDADLFAEMAALRHEHPVLSPAAVLRMATLNGARALGLAGELGTLETGKLAASVVVPLPTPEDDPLEVVTGGPEVVYPVDAAPAGGPAP
jgi:cytosine/adenosine deaminase-related metal-dependent hydrolase